MVSETLTCTPRPQTGSAPVTRAQRTEEQSTRQGPQAFLTHQPKLAGDRGTDGCTRMEGRGGGVETGGAAMTELTIFPSFLSSGLSTQVTLLGSP